MISHSVCLSSSDLLHFVWSSLIPSMSCKWQNHALFLWRSRIPLLEKGMVTHSSILAWRIPRTEGPGGLQPVVLQRVRHKWATNTHTVLIGPLHILVNLKENALPTSRWRLCSLTQIPFPGWHPHSLAATEFWLRDACPLHEKVGAPHKPWTG